MTTQSVPAPAALTREAPSLGGFNVTVLRLEIRRLLRNRRTVIFALIFPVVFFLAFGLNSAYANESAGPGSHGNVSAFVMISMALYGAVLATTSGAASVWIGSLVFAAFGLFMGYLLPTENVMQFLGLGLALLSFAGGLFIPLSQFPQIYQDIAEYTPLYGLNQLVHAPLLGIGVQWAWAANAVIWLAIFAGGAAWRF